MGRTRGRRGRHAKDSDHERDQQQAAATGQSQQLQQAKASGDANSTTTTATAAPSAGSTAWMRSGVPASGRLGMLLARLLERCCSSDSFIVMLTLVYLVMRSVQSDCMMLLPPQMATVAYGAVRAVHYIVLIMMQLEVISTMCSWLDDWTAMIARLVIQVISPTAAAGGGAVPLVPLVGLTNAQSCFVMTCSGRFVLQRLFGGYYMLMWLLWGVLTVALPKVAADVLPAAVHSSTMMLSICAVCLFVVYFGAAGLLETAASKASKPRMDALYSSMSAELNAGTCAVEPHIIFDSLDFLERLVLGIAPCVFSVATPAGRTAAWSSLCGRVSAAAKAGCRLVMSISRVVGSWVLGCLRRVLPALGFLHLISMPWQFVYFSKLLYASNFSLAGFWGEMLKILVALLQLAVLPGSHVIIRLTDAKDCSAFEQGMGHSWMMIFSNYLFWICTTFRSPSCTTHPSACSSVVPSSLFWMMVGLHYVLAGPWLGMAVGPDVPVSSPLLASLQRLVTRWYWGRWGAPYSVPRGTEILWSARLPLGLILGPMHVIGWHLAVHSATKRSQHVVAVCAQLPSRLQSACRALQCCSYGSVVAACCISAAMVFLLCVVAYLQHMFEHRAQLWAAVVLHVAGFKLKFIRCTQSALRLPRLRMQLSGPLLKSWFVSVKHRLIMFSIPWPVSHGACMAVRTPSCEGSTAASKACPAEDSRGCPGVCHAQREQQPASGCVSQRDEALKAEAQEAIMECIVCQDAVRSVALKPCGHLACCEACFVRLQRDGSRCSSGRGSGPGGLKCPVCRADVQGYVAGIIL